MGLPSRPGQANLYREQLYHPSFFRPDGLPAERRPAEPGQAYRAGLFGDQLWDGAADARRAAHRADGRPPDYGRLSAYCPCDLRPPAQAGAAAAFRYDPVQADGPGGGRADADLAAERAAYPTA